MVFKALRAEGSDPAANLALEEALLALPPAASALLVVYVNDPCVVVGRNQNPWAEVSRDSGLPVLRRISGGGAVYHDRGNLNWALIVPRDRHDPHAELELVAEALRGAGIDVAAGSRGGLYAGGAPTSVARKISGTARRFGACRVLHHGTLLVRADLARLESCLGGLPLRASRAVASVPGRPVNMTDLGSGLDVEGAMELLTSTLGSGARVEVAEDFVRDAGVEGVAEAARLRHASWSWTWGETPAFSVSASGTRGELVIQVSRGRVDRVEGPGADLLGRLVGRRFDYDMPADPARFRER